MSTTNICKFVHAPENVVAELGVINFVYEITDAGKEECIRSVYRMHIVLRGEGFFVCNGVSFSLKEGDVFFTFPNSFYAIKGEQNFEYGYVSFIGLGAPRLIRRILPVFDRQMIFEGHRDLIGIWKNALEKANANNVDLIAKGILEYSASMLIEKPPLGADADVVVEMEKYLRENFYLSDISLKDLAVKYGYSEKYLSRLFYSRTGTCFKDYLAGLRINAACGMLQSDGRSIKEIAADCGFSDPLYFSKVFKKTTGLSPSEFRTEKQIDNMGRDSIRHH